MIFQASTLCILRISSAHYTIFNTKDIHYTVHKISKTYLSTCCKFIPLNYISPIPPHPAPGNYHLNLIPTGNHLMQPIGWLIVSCWVTWLFWFTPTLMSIPGHSVFTQKIPIAPGIPWLSWFPWRLSGLNGVLYHLIHNISNGGNLHYWRHFPETSTRSLITK